MNNLKWDGLGLLALLAVSIVSIRYGAVSIPLNHVWGYFTQAIAGVGPMPSAQEINVIYELRLPRLILGLLVGATLGICGAAIQGLFRNPLADPGMLGVSSGGALFAVTGILILQQFAIAHSAAGPLAIIIITFLGALLTSALIFFMASRKGSSTSTTQLILTGIAINAFAGAGTGLIMYMANEAQLRSITFWMLGSLAGANWTQITLVAPFLVASILALPWLGKSLNVLALGETNAFYMGFKVQHIKIYCIILVALGVGAAVAVSGMIGFIGLTVPHMVRIISGSSYTQILYRSAWMGALVLATADIGARTLALPSEIPIGVITSLVGAPFFLYVLQKNKTVTS